MKKKIATGDRINAPSQKTGKEFIALRKPRKDDGDKYGLENCCVNNYWAVVERNGSLVRGRSVLRTNRISEGIYEVFFTGKVDNGVFVATIGRPGYFTEPPGYISVALRWGPGVGKWTPFDDDRGVWVETFDMNGKHRDRSFHLMVNTQ